MASYYSFITDEQAALIRNTPLFFVASADPQLANGPDGVGPVNLSPKGGVPLYIVDRKRVAFLDYPGSGNETSRHSAAGGPVTVMICSFEEENAGIVRLYGTARVTPVAQSPIAGQLMRETRVHHKRPRNVVEIMIESTMTSCGYVVPVMTLVRERRETDRGRCYKAVP
jgi:hypothetical protein